MSDLIATPLLWLAVTLVVFEAADMLSRRSGRHPLCHPVLLATPVLIGVLLATRTPYPTYAEATQVLGFLLGLAAGILLAALSARSHLAETLLWPFMATIKSVPVASFIVICLIWLSAQNVSVFISFLVVMPVVYGNMLSGIRAVDKNLLEMSRVFRMSGVRRFKYIYLPELKPYIMSACGTALGMSWKAGVAAEIIGTPNDSIGKELYYAKIWLDTDDLLCWTVIIVICSAAFEKLFMAAVRGMYRRLEGEA